MKNFDPSNANSEQIISHSNYEGKAVFLRKLIVKMSTATHEPSRPLAQTLATHAVKNRWAVLTRDRHHSPPLRCPPGVVCPNVLSANLSDLAAQFGEVIANCNAQFAAYEVGMLYTSLLPKSAKSLNGIFYSPPAISGMLLALANDAKADWTRHLFLEPSCGGGVILTAIAERMIDAIKRQPSSEILAHLSKNLVGYEIDPFGAWLAQVSIDFLALPFCTDEDSRFPVIVRCTDTLAVNDNEQFDFVIGNPPFGRTKLTDEQRRHFERSTFGHANLYALFWDQALRLVRLGGTIVFVTPTSFLSGRYSSKLRNLLSEHTEPKRLQFFRSRSSLFEGVRQEMVISSVTRIEPRSLITVEEISDGAHGELEIYQLGQHQITRVPGSPWLLPRSQAEAGMENILNGFECRLADLGYSVSTGPLIWNRHKERLRSNKTGTSVPLIWSEAIRPLGVFQWRASRHQGKIWFETANGSEHLLCKEPCILVQRATTKEQPRRLVAALLPKTFLDEHVSVVVENHINIIRPIQNKPQVNLAVLASYLNSETADNVLRCIAGSTSVSASDLLTMPLPCPGKIACYL
ncbi:HsdM family class I SAM-dependent methyltransferase [Roseobacter sp. GAI101]|uniref:HsdM family class I SAM-dependent methyltransferase n=1 Tax=Roseobacter sp. (strain GAI101) TaxID=391589 RepID=UPI0001872054|nr:Eco57I restriction-modification methylase domain-containing protein [Roseobacter sp. GAI101]EEB82371.1 restriction methylase [Roseobacter sp. GAI101]